MISGWPFSCFLSQGRDHRQPGGVELLRRRRGLAARDAVGLLDQRDGEAGLARDAGCGLDVGRFDPAAGPVSEHQRSLRLLRGVEVGPGGAVRCLDLERLRYEYIPVNWPPVTLMTWPLM